VFVNGKYVGSDPDPTIRSMLARDSGFEWWQSVAGGGRLSGRPAACRRPELWFCDFARWNFDWPDASGRLVVPGGALFCDQPWSRARPSSPPL